VKLMNPFALVRATCAAADRVIHASEQVQEAARQKKLIVVEDRDKVPMNDQDRELKDA